MLHPTVLQLFWQQDTGTGNQAEGQCSPTTRKETHLSARKSWAARAEAVESRCSPGDFSQSWIPEIHSVRLCPVCHFPKAAKMG